MALIVQKFGGASVANRERLINAARIAADAQGVAPALVLVLLAHWFRQSEQCPGLSVYAAHWTAARRSLLAR